MVSIREGCENMDFDKVTDMLSKSYWSPGIGKDEVMKGAENSALVIGAFFGKEQIGYARVISDKVRFAYMCDVYVDERYRGHGLGQELVNHILGHESLKDVYQWMLSTRDAHSLYASCGFQPLAEPQRMMALRRFRQDNAHKRPL
jgi:GNAT superfamily N-acetyltransferase